MVKDWNAFSNAIRVLEAGTFKLKAATNFIDLFDNGLLTVQPGTFVLPGTGDQCSTRPTGGSFATEAVGLSEVVWSILSSTKANIYTKISETEMWSTMRSNYPGLGGQLPVA